MEQIREIGRIWVRAVQDTMGQIEEYWERQARETEDQRRGGDDQQQGESNEDPGAEPDHAYEDVAQDDIEIEPDQVYEDEVQDDFEAGRDNMELPARESPDWREPNVGAPSLWPEPVQGGAQHGARQPEDHPETHIWLRGGCSDKCSRVHRFSFQV